MLRVLVIDDERAVRSLIGDMISRFVPQASVVGEAESVSTGLQAIRKVNPDIVLLDIKMSDGTGFDLLNQVDELTFKVIFITAYENHAIQAFKYSAVDYILKPIDPDELVSAILKAGSILQQEMIQRLNALRENINPDNAQKNILVKTASDIHLIRARDLVCCESDQVYTKLFLADGRKIMVSRPLREFDELLQGDGFFRIHRSFLINMMHFDHFERADGGYVLMRNGLRIPVASRKRDYFLKMIENMT